VQHWTTPLSSAVNTTTTTEHQQQCILMTFNCSCMYCIVFLSSSLFLFMRVFLRQMLIACLTVALLVSFTTSCINCRQSRVQSAKERRCDRKRGRITNVKLHVVICRQSRVPTTLQLYPSRLLDAVVCHTADSISIGHRI